MTTPYHSTPTQESTNNRTAQPTIGERHREAYAQRQRPARLGLWAKVRPMLVGGLAGLALGGAVVGLAAYEVMPIRGVPVENVIIDLNADGQPDFLITGLVIYSPNGSGQ